MDDESEIFHILHELRVCNNEHKVAKWRARYRVIGIWSSRRRRRCFVVAFGVFTKSRRQEQNSTVEYTAQHPQGSGVSLSFILKICRSSFVLSRVSIRQNNLHSDIVKILVWSDDRINFYTWWMLPTRRQWEQFAWGDTRKCLRCWIQINPCAENNLSIWPRMYTYERPIPPREVLASPAPSFEPRTASYALYLQWMWHRDHIFGRLTVPLAIENCLV